MKPVMDDVRAVAEAMPRLSGSVQRVTRAGAVVVTSPEGQRHEADLESARLDKRCAMASREEGRNG